MRILTILALSIFLSACSSKTKDPVGGPGTKVPFSKADFPNATNEIYGVWLGRIGVTATSGGFNQTLAFNRDGKFGVGMECDDKSGKIWASAIVKAKIEPNSIYFDQKIEGHASDQKGNACSFEMMPRTFYYSLNGTGDQLSVYAPDGSGHEIYTRVQ
jgi:hypothetical protein